MMQRLILLLLLVSTVEASAQWPYRHKLKDTAYVASRGFKKIRVLRQDLRDYGSTKQKHSKRWQVEEQFAFKPDGSIASYRAARAGKPNRVPFQNLGSKTTQETDSLGRLRRETFWHQDRVVYDDYFRYDAQGRLQQVLRGKGPAQPPKLFRELYYDKAGREVEQRFYPSHFSSVNALPHSINGPGLQRLFYTEGRVWASEFRSAPDQFPGYLDSLYYDAQGRVIAQATYLLPYNGFPLKLSRALRRAYLSNGERAWERRWSDDPQQSGELVTWTYDAAGNLLSSVEQQYVKYHAYGHDQGYNRYQRSRLRYNSHGDFVEIRETYQHEEPLGQVQEEQVIETTRLKIKYYR